MMRRIIIVLVLALFTFSLASAAPPKRDKDSKSHWYHHGDDNISMDFEDGTLIITNRGRDKETVEITEDYRLFVNGREVKTDKKQRELLREYYRSMEQLVESAAVIGIEGAKIGVKGAEIGVAAIAGLFCLLSEDYDTDDYERDMERKSAKLEIKAEKLEKEAEKLEENVEELEELADELSDEIPELRRLEWF